MDHDLVGYLLYGRPRQRRLPYWPVFWDPPVPMPALGTKFWQRNGGKPGWFNEYVTIDRGDDPAKEAAL